MEKKNGISRKQFLQACGTVVAGGGILGVSSVLMRKRAGRTGGSAAQPAVSISGSKPETGFVSPYKQVASFDLHDEIDAIELSGGNLIVSAGGYVNVCDRQGNAINRFFAGNNLRDIAAEGDNIYLLFPSRIAVYGRDGSLKRAWEARSQQADYCAMTLAEGFVFVTDAANKNICKYTVDGVLAKFIASPEGFVIPSYTFGVAFAGGILYCSNSGRHRIEKYTVDGDFLGSFGKAGGAAGMFCGCCNPVHISCAGTGEIITSEKGNPRISCYGGDGRFRSLLMNAQSLGGGHKAYDVKADGDHLFIAGGKRVTVYRYDHQTALHTDCAACGVDCPLKKG